MDIINTEFSKVNWERCIGPFKCGNKNNLYFTTALAEEVGEVAGVVKKLDRGFNNREAIKIIKKHSKDFPNAKELLDRMEEEGDSRSILDILSTGTCMELEDLWHEELRKKLSKELADVFTYLDLVATKNEIDLGKAIVEKFNQVSKEMGCEEFKI